MKLKKITVIAFTLLLGAALTVPAFAYCFSDMEGHWGADYIETAQEKGVVNGYPDGSFRPDQQVSYKEAATMICNAINSSGLKELDMEAQDEYAQELAAVGVEGDWSAGYVAALFDQDAAAVSDFRNGNDQGAGASPAQRQVIGSWAIRMLNIPVSPLCDLSNYSDAASVDLAYAGEVEALARCGIMSGYPDGSYRPERIVTRAEFAKVCVTMLDTIAARQEESGRHTMADSLFLRTGSLQGLDAAGRTVTFSFGGTYVIPQDTLIVADGKAIALEELEALADKSLVVSYLKDQESALILQTAPMVESGKIEAVSAEEDFWLLGIRTGSGETVNYLLSMDDGMELPSEGDQVSFIAEGARIIEMQ